jgi:thiol-disulfide isomerase/thioredoxin
MPTAETPPTPLPAPGATGRRRGATRRAAPTVVATVLVALALTGCGSGSSTSAEGVVAEPLVELDGGAETTLAAVTDGRPLVVNLWASWCVPCLEEMPAFDEVHRERGEEVAIVGVTDDTPDDAARMAERTGVTYPLLLDEERAVARALGAAGLPLTVFLGSDGEVLGRHQGALDAEGLRDQIDRYLPDAGADGGGA